MRIPAEGERIVGPDYDDELRSGVVVDVLSVMLFVRYDNGSECFVYKVDKRLRREDDE